MDCRAVDSALVLLSSHLNLSSPAFSRVCCLLASSPLVSGCFVMLACCLGCVLSLFVPVPCVILASDVFLSGWLLGPLSGLTPGGFPSWLFALIGPCPPSLCVRLAVSRLCFSAPFLCLAQFLASGVSLGYSRLSWLARSSRVGCFALFLFSGLFCFVFPYPDSLALLCLWWCLSGCFFPPWPSFLGRHFCL